MSTYAKVKIHNSTGYEVIDGKVEYMACSTDKFDIDVDREWSHQRGGCLITKIKATVKAAGGDVGAASYSSPSGTSYSNFAVIRTGNTYKVTRVVSGEEGEEETESAEAAETTA